VKISSLMLEEFNYLRRSGAALSCWRCGVRQAAQDTKTSNSQARPMHFQKGGSAVTPSERSLWQKGRRSSSSSGEGAATASERRSQILPSRAAGTGAEVPRKGPGVNPFEVFGVCGPGHCGSVYAKHDNLALGDGRGGHGGGASGGDGQRGTGAAGIGAAASSGNAAGVGQSALSVSASNPGGGGGGGFYGGHSGGQGANIFGGSGAGAAVSLAASQATLRLEFLRRRSGAASKGGSRRQPGLARRGRQATAAMDGRGSLHFLFALLSAPVEFVLPQVSPLSLSSCSRISSAFFLSLIAAPA
jgi:hypothetical protein